MTKTRLRHEAEVSPSSIVITALHCVSFHFTRMYLFKTIIAVNNRIDYGYFKSCSIVYVCVRVSSMLEAAALCPGSDGGRPSLGTLREGPSSSGLSQTASLGCCLFFKNASNFKHIQSRASYTVKSRKRLEFMVIVIGKSTPRICLFRGKMTN